MRWADVINLVNVTEGTDDYGFPSNTETIKENIYANKMSIYSNEHYMAKQVGVELTVRFEVRSIDYSGEDYIEHNGKRYAVERTYDKGEFIELTCKDVADDHTTG